MIDVLQMLIKPTGPQLEAKTVPMKIVIQKILCGNNMLSMRTMMLIRAIAKRVLRRLLWRVDDLMSLLALNPTNDKNVDAEDRAAQMIPAIKTAPR